MEQLIFIAVIVLVSILESQARRRKKKAEAGSTRGPEAGGASDELPTYDSGPSYDQLEVDEAARRGRAASSEGMIPADIWEEIVGLAQASKARRRAPEVSRKPEPVPPPATTTPARRRKLAPKRTEPHRALHLTHAEYGTDPSARSRSEQDGLDPLARQLAADASSIRRQLRSHGAHALRQAVILHEVLGPPAATRPDRFEE